MALITRTVFFTNRGMRRTRQTKVLLILQRATAMKLLFFLSPFLIQTAKIFHKTWLKFQRSPFASRYSEVEEILIAESIQEWVRFFFVISLSAFLKSSPPTRIHQASSLTNLWFFDFMEQRYFEREATYANSQMEVC